MKSVTWTFFGGATILLGLRIYFKVLRRRSLWWDDYILIAAWALSLGDNIVTMVNMSGGFGKHIYDLSPEDVSNIILRIAICTTLNIMSLMASKTSFALTILRLASGFTIFVVWFIIVSTNTSLSVSLLLNYFRCWPPKKSWRSDITGTCMSPAAYTGYKSFAAAYSGIMDIALALIPWTIIWKASLRKKEMAGVAFAMSLGIFAGATAFIKLAYLHSLEGDKDFTYNGTKLVIWAKLEVSVSIIAACIPTLRVLLCEVVARHRGSEIETAQPVTFNDMYNDIIPANLNEPASWEVDSQSTKGILDKTTSSSRPTTQTSESMVGSQDIPRPAKGRLGG
ncbi:hypothetical protein B0J13DRAFT_680257 [Dactylonectria estremocensis]|uniref:Rhodopsin domain-containing protein n=1 Tax=Dactylonectria estremocensis TaxID=1079267 RepID=A0A9P9DNB8_9HYPO|nr:hypothetical protein B0J13DRAFT_680257 [Dactylonectria estremocensis]